MDLKYYDGYFMHHVRVYARKHRGSFLPIVHRSGSLPMIAGGKETMEWRAPSWDLGPLPDGAKTFATSEEAEAYAKKIVDETTGAYCRDFYYRR